jgi:hypothetical protein
VHTPQSASNVKGVRNVLTEGAEAYKQGSIQIRAAPGRQTEAEDEVETLCAQLLSTRKHENGLRNQFVDLGAGGAVDPTGMRRPVSSRSRLAHPAAVGLELSASHGAGAGVERSEDSAVEAEALPPCFQP